MYSFRVLQAYTGDKKWGQWCLFSFGQCCLTWPCLYSTLKIGPPWECILLFRTNKNFWPSSTACWICWNCLGTAKVNRIHWKCTAVFQNAEWWVGVTRDDSLWPDLREWQDMVRWILSGGKGALEGSGLHSELITGCLVECIPRDFPIPPLSCSSMFQQDVWQ